MTTFVLIAALLVVLACALAVADRALAARVERRAAVLLSDPLGAPAQVRIIGTPFLGQAVRGRFNDVEISGAGVPVAAMRAERLDARLRNVYLPVRDLLTGRVEELPCEHLEGRILLSYAELARVSPVPGLAFEFAEGLLRATAALPVPGISALARVSGQARLQVRDGEVWLSVSRFAVAGLSVTSVVLGQLVPQLNVVVPLAALPWGLRLERITPTAGGLVVEAAAAAIVLRSQPDPAR